MIRKSSYFLSKDEETSARILKLCKMHGYKVYTHKGFISVHCGNVSSLNNFPYTSFSHVISETRYAAGICFIETVKEKGGKPVSGVAVFGPQNVEVMAGCIRSKDQLKSAISTCCFRAGVSLLWTQADVDNYIAVTSNLHAQI